MNVTKHIKIESHASMFRLGGSFFYYSKDSQNVWGYKYLIRIGNIAFNILKQK